MKRFEHKYHELFGEPAKFIEEFDQLSEDGWELVAIMRRVAFLKRLCAVDYRGQTIRPGDQVREGIIHEIGTVMRIAEPNNVLKLLVKFPNADGESFFESWISIDFLEAISS